MAEVSEQSKVQGGAVSGQAVGAHEASQRGAAPAAAARSHRHGWLRALVCVLLLVLALLLALTIGDANYRATAVGWVPFITLVFLITLSWAYVRVSAGVLQVGNLALMKDCSRGQEVNFSVFVKNRTPFPLFGVEAAFAVSAANGQAAHEAQSTLVMAPFEESSLDFAVTFDHVGRFQVGITNVVVSDFLGLFQRQLATSGTCEVNVTPVLVQLDRVHFENRAMEDVLTPQKAVLADSMDYAYVRPYVAGDPLKTVHWKLSARADALQTRLFEQTTNPGVVIALDFSVPPEVENAQLQLIDCVIESGLSYAQHAQREGIELEIHYVDKSGEVQVLTHWDDDMAVRFVESMPDDFTGQAAQKAAAALYDSLKAPACRQPNVVLCSADTSQRLLSAATEAKLSRRQPMVIAAIPPDVVDRGRERYLAPLEQLRGAGIATEAISYANELSGVVA